MFNFNNKTVDGVLSAFRTAINDLQAVASEHTAKAAEHDKAATVLLASKAAAEAEATRASAIAAQMESVFN